MVANFNFSLANSGICFGLKNVKRKKYKSNKIIWREFNMKWKHMKGKNFLCGWNCFFLQFSSKATLFLLYSFPVYVVSNVITQNGKRITEENIGESWRKENVARKTVLSSNVWRLEWRGCRCERGKCFEVKCGIVGQKLPFQSLFNNGNAISFKAALQLSWRPFEGKLSQALKVYWSMYHEGNSRFNEAFSFANTSKIFTKSTRSAFMFGMIACTLL